MLWVTFLLIANARAQTSTLQEQEKSPRNRILFNELSLTYDHCRSPQILNRETWTCECPAPLEKKGDECVCDGCLFTVKNESYVEKEGTTLPEYIDPFVKELNEEEEEERRISESSGDGVARRMLWKTKRSSSKKAVKPKKSLSNTEKRKIQRYLKRIASILDGVRVNCPKLESSLGRRSESLKNARVIVANRDSSLYNFLKGLQANKRTKPDAPKIRLKKIDWEKAKILNLRKVSKTKPLEGDTFSDSTVGEGTRGRVKFGSDKAFGAMTNLYGTGSLSLGAGDGSAAASAYTGQGLSATGVESLGAKAYGVGMIGKKAIRGASSTTLLLGQGDAIATNSQSTKSSASATAIATKAAASAGSTAYGSATASASATPGKGSADGSAVYGDDLKVSALVSKGKGPVAETVAVGRPEDDLRTFIDQQRQSRVNSNLSADYFLRTSNPPSSDFDLLDVNNGVSDWFIK